MTQPQRRLMSAIEAHVRQHGVPPSFEEMRRAVGAASKSGVHRMIGCLVESGHLARRQNRARALEVLRPVTGLSAAEVDWCHAHAAAVRSLMAEAGHG